MATTTLTPGHLHIRFTAAERMWTRRQQLTVPLTAVRDVTTVAEPLRLARGARSGLTVSGFVKIGTWGIFGGPRQLVSARAGQPGLHLTVDRTATGYDEILLSDPTAPTIAAAIRHAT
ncbi:hypothetical protein [Micromonospora peucetia]|uniref:PH domain-containing protein n=1 Tax=Micromonospora peucetia TaxID=47871 RepID=A0A1C6W1Y2_9ACTN|nr:hypothetical protein [Micromonospora peucetia]WSA31999.1 hypothetical protein OIE14_28420 [Micromonospora peucetia]SCL72541.1 hypothetical protein GA0070608_5056 [Micromonospora peucetia]